MDRILIDANMYLNFYRSVEMRAQLNRMRDLRSYLIVPRQVADEVRRRRAIEVNGKWSAGSKLFQAFLPDSLLDDEQLGTLQRQFRVVRTHYNNFAKELEDLRLKVLQDVSVGSDPVSLVLDELFSNAIEPTAEEIDRARGRRERGNPPGDRSNPLGDQIVWEQVLTIATNCDRLWIITADQDYGIVVSRRLLLNPLLMSELRRVRPGIQVKSFPKLADGLPDIIKTIGDGPPMSTDEVSNLRSAELAAASKGTQREYSDEELGDFLTMPEQDLLQEYESWSTNLAETTAALKDYQRRFAEIDATEKQRRGGHSQEWYKLHRMCDEKQGEIYCVEQHYGWAEAAMRRRGISLPQE